MKNAAKLLIVLLFASSLARAGVAVTDWRVSVKPDAIVDLRTNDGAALLNGQWRVRDAQIVQTDGTRDITPQASAADFDDRDWERLDAAALESRRGAGRLSFVWYRVHVTLPEMLGEFATRGSTAVFEIVADDYAEVSVNGRLPLVLGQQGGNLVAGWNAPNRVTLTRDAKPGEQFVIAVLAANAPLSKPPTNKVWIRSASLKFYAPGKLALSEPAKLEVVKFDPAIDEIIVPGTKAEKLATGFGFTEGPVWHPDGYLLFSDPNNNHIHRYDPTDGGVSIFRTNSGYSGIDIGRYRQPGSNGLAIDPQGRLTINEHGNRRVTRIERNGTLTVLADRYNGKRLNSPNDLLYRSDGTLFFTDPPFGLPRVYDHPSKELPFVGVFVLSPSGQLKLVSTDLKGPNGIALSPDEKQIYVSNWDEKHKIVMRYDVAADGTLSGGTVFANVTGESGDEALDGLKVDRAGNVFVSGPGGVWVFSSSGKRLGLLKLDELPANMAWGGVDGRTLFLTARTSIYRIQVETDVTQPPTSTAPTAVAR